MNQITTISITSYTITISKRKSFYESTSAIGTKKLLIACRFFDSDKYL